MKEHDREFDKIIKFIEDGQRFTVLTHISPDGDTLGSALAMYLLLTKMGKGVQIVCSNPVPKIYSFLPNADKVIFPESAERYEWAITIDCADKPRCGRAVQLLDSAESTASIDHHFTNPNFADNNLVIADASATAEIMHEIFCRMDMPFDEEAMKCLYTGIVTDTGNLTYSNTTPNAIRIIADFLERGLDISDLNRRIYRTIPYNKARLQGYVTSRIHLEADGKIGIAVLTQAELHGFDATNEDCEGIVDCVRDIDCVMIAAFIREGSDGSYKVSLRSKQIGDVARLANKYGGGGHARAAGFKAYEPLSTVIANVIDSAMAELSESECF